MEKEERKKKFIQAWGKLGPKWGINRTMAQIHALLLISEEPQCYQCIKDKLDISMGCINMNLKTLQSWELISGVEVPGERKEFFVAEKDIWKVFQRIVKHRKEEELSPLLLLLDELSTPESNQQKVEEQDFFNTINEIKSLATHVDKVLSTVSTGENQWLMKGLNLMMR